MKDQAERGDGSAYRLAWRVFRGIGDFLARVGFKKVPGASRVYVFLLRNLRSPRGTVLIESHGNKMYSYLGDEGGLAALKAGIFEEYETGLFKRLLKPGMVVVDIGANIGHYSLIAARLVGNSGRVYSFEPEPHNYELLCRNIELNGFKNVMAVNKAVSNEIGSLTLYLDKLNLGAHSLSTDNVSSFSSGIVEVETTTLEAFFDEVGADRVDIIKMDTQGAEGLIVEGAHRMLEDNNPKILMELWPFGLRNVGYDPATLATNLQRLGFSFKVIDKTGEKAKTMDADGVIKLCANMKSGSQVNLFLEKVSYWS